MERITLAQFGPATRFDAAEVIDDSGRIVACIAAPEARDICTSGNGEWYPAEGWDEDAFRAAVEAEVASWEAKETDEKVWVQYDPGCNHASEVSVALKG